MIIDSDSNSPLKIGQYEILDEIAHGPLTTVYSAFEAALNRKVLIKKLHRHLVAENDIRERFVREARACAQINHPNIVEIYNFHISQKDAYLVLEYVDGKNLHQVMSEKRLPLELSLAIIVEICKGMAYAHERGVIHRDIKPQNILVSKEGQVKISDFGLATLEDSPSLTYQGVVIGTPAYMSPEQAAGKKVDFRTDIFSLGVVFFEILSGVSVFKADSVSKSLRKIISEPIPRINQFRTDLPAKLEKIVDKMLERNPSKRFDTASEIVEEISELSEESNLNVSPKLIRRCLQENETGSTTTAIDISKDSGIAVRKNRRRLLPVYAAVLTALIALTVFLINYKPFAPAMYDIVDSSIVKSEIPPLTDSLIAHRLQSQISDSLPMKEESSTPDTVKIVSQPAQEHSKIDESVGRESVVKNESEIEYIKKSPGGIKEPAKTAADNIKPKDESVINDYKTGQLTINCIPWADIYLDDKLLGQPPFAGSFEITPGIHKLTFVRPDYPVVFHTLDIYPGESLNVKINLWDHLGVLKVTVSNTWAEIWIDDQFIDRTPRADPIVVPLGKHKITLKNPNFAQWEKEIVFKEGGQPEELVVRLETIVENDQ
ncbi:serine/threonine protein kinase [bacterium]|nr:serine/threonine protein kinase [FCB group bacterium]MBL7191491.1 serine/threonine protein kinase [bacterium]